MADEVFREVPAQFTGPTGRLTDRFNLSKVSWGAIWAGAMVTIGMEALFLSFGIFIDAAFDGSTPWAMAWYLVTMAGSFYLGAWTSARLSDVSVRELCALHGLTTWGLATLGTILMIGTALFAGLRLGTTLLVNSAGAAPAAARLDLWGPTLEYSGVIWGGVILSLFCAYIGGLAGMPKRVAAQEAPTAPMRRAS